MNRVVLFSIAFVVINRFIFPDSSIAQLSSPNPAWTFSEMRACDSSLPLPTGSATKEYIEKAPAPELSPPQCLAYFVRHLSSDVELIAADALHELSLAGMKPVAKFCAFKASVTRLSLGSRSIVDVWSGTTIHAPNELNYPAQDASLDDTYHGKRLRDEVGIKFDERRSRICDHRRE